MDINQINSTIRELEAGDATFDSCHKLACLYTVRDRLSNSRQNKAIRDLTDIFPCYSQYVENKRKYKLKEISAECLYPGINLLCLEISNFIHDIYSSCDTEMERTELSNMIDSLHSFLI